MTNVFEINIDDSENTAPSKLFLEKELSPDLVAETEKSDAAAKEHEKKFQLPIWLRLIRTILFGVAAIIFLSLLRADVTMEEAYQNAPALFFIMPAAFAGFIALWIIEYVRKKTHQNTEDFEHFQDKAENLIKACKYDLGIPETAPQVDILCYTYKINKKGKQVKAVDMYDYMLVPLYTYQDASKIYLADNSSVYAFLKSDFMRMEKIEKRYSMCGWNKDEDISSDKYKKYKLTANNYDAVFCKYYYSLQMINVNGAFEILIPPYEAPIFASVLNLPFDD